MSNLSALASMLLSFVIGAGVGALLLSRWWFKRMQDPKVARDFIRTMYQRTHPHRLQVSRDDNRLVCPCCGWTEGER